MLSVCMFGMILHIFATCKHVYVFVCVCESVCVFEKKSYSPPRKGLHPAPSPQVPVTIPGQQPWIAALTVTSHPCQRDLRVLPWKVRLSVAAEEASQMGSLFLNRCARRGKSPCTQNALRTRGLGRVGTADLKVGRSKVVDPDSSRQRAAGNSRNPVERQSANETCNKAIVAVAKYQ